MDDLDMEPRLRDAGRGVEPSLDFDDLTRARERRRTRRQRRTAAMVGMVSMVVIGALLVGLRFETHGHGAALSGGGVRARGGSALAPGQYLYLRQSIVVDNGRIVTQTWWASDDSGRIAFDCTVPNCAKTSPTGTYGPGDFPTDDDVSGLSADPSVLLGQMEQRTAPGGSSPEPEFSPGPELTAGVTTGSLWDAGSNILQDPTGGPDLRAALVQVLSNLPGVQVQTGVTDPAGRPATALVLNGVLDGGAPRAMYIDPTSDQLMAEGAPPGSGGPTGSVLYDEGVVGSTDAPPSGGEWLFPPSG
jgi:hypothetical protein